jgi:hypothetical protein
MAALAPPRDSVHDDHDLPASDVVDFTPFREVTTFEPSFKKFDIVYNIYRMRSFKTWHGAIATRSISLLLKPPLHGDYFSDNTTTYAAVAVPGVHQSTTTPPRASRTVLWRRRQHYSTARLRLDAYRQWRTRVRPSIPLRPPADHDPCKRPPVPTPLVTSLPAFYVPSSELDVLPHLGPTP